METASATIRSSLRGARRWRSLLAGLISFALVVSFFHGWTFDGDDGAASAVAIAQSINDAGGNAPAHPASLHGDHCLTHVASVVPLEAAFPVEYSRHAYGDAGMYLPGSADRLSPFKPPRA
ncbi:MAG: hypothetical protein V7632_1422 [Bradyrhizobium sp.]|jgi:hypothetical protein